MREFIGFWVAVLVLAATVAANAQGQPACACIVCNLDNVGTNPVATATDYAVFVGAFGKSVAEPGYSPRADFDRNGTVTVVDWATMLKCCPLGGR